MTQVEVQDFVTRFAAAWAARDGKIAEEVVYSDTAPLRAFRSGQPLEPITKF